MEVIKAQQQNVSKNILLKQQQIQGLDGRTMAIGTEQVLQERNKLIRVAEETKLKYAQLNAQLKQIQSRRSKLTSEKTTMENMLRQVL